MQICYRKTFSVAFSRCIFATTDDAVNHDTGAVTFVMFAMFAVFAVFAIFATFVTFAISAMCDTSDITTSIMLYRL
jgi:hypothetical protein